MTVVCAVGVLVVVLLVAIGIWAANDSRRSQQDAANRQLVAATRAVERWLADGTLEEFSVLESDLKRAIGDENVTEGHEKARFLLERARLRYDEGEASQMLQDAQAAIREDRFADAVSLLESYLKHPRAEKLEDAASLRDHAQLLSSARSCQDVIKGFSDDHLDALDQDGTLPDSIRPADDLIAQAYVRRLRGLVPEEKQRRENLTSAMPPAGGGKQPPPKPSPPKRQPIGQVCTYDLHKGPVRCVSFSLDGRLAASAGNDMVIRIWDPATGNIVGTLEGHRWPVNCIRFTPDGKRLVSASTNDPRATTVLAVLTGDANKWDIDDYSLRLWDLGRYKEIHSFDDHLQPVDALAVSPKGNQVLASTHGTAVLFDIQSGKQIRTFAGDTDRRREPIHNVEFSPDGSQILTESAFSLRTWKVNTGEQIRLYGSPDGRDPGPRFCSLSWFTNSLCIYGQGGATAPAAQILFTIGDHFEGLHIQRGRSR